jgi:transcriptional regulator with XRE-family HTH domain
MIVPGKIVPGIVAMPTMDLKEAMATNVRRARHARKLTQEELADLAGLSARYLGSIERGTVSASVTVLGRLARALRVDACELIRAPARR